MLLLHSSAGRYGADRQLALIATGLDPARYRALVVVPEAGALVDDLRQAGVETLVAPLAVVRRALATPAGLARLARAWGADALRLSRLVRTRNAALVHSNTSVILGGAPAARLARVPHVWHVREIYAGFERWWPAHRRLLLTAAALPCVSEATRAQFGSHPRPQVILDGLAFPPPQGAESLEGLRPPRGLRREESAAVDTIRARWSLAPGAFVCTVLGRLSDWKGQDVLIRALADPRLRAVGAVALIAGEPWEGRARTDELRRLAASLGVEQQTRLVGFVPDPEPLYAASDVVVVPSTRPDPLPNAALEAAAAGCCVVASAHGGLPEIISDGRTGRLVSPGDPGALAAVLAELAADPELCRRLGAAASADVTARFSPQQLLERVQALYDHLLTR
ncbi:MAG TPA: glycosyltransferase family 4 protein [Solirubrobacteraceae bacterium]|nr:glycosyltransferase family 4 protein [Solirubrobacteraceae bacterium]